VVIWGGYDRAYSARYGARDPLLAPWPRLMTYLVWRGFVAAVRPVIFLILLGCGFVLMISALGRAPGPVTPPVELDQQIAAAFTDAAPDRMDRRGLWLDAIEQALEPRWRSAPDLPLAQSYAEAAIMIEGREALAMAVLREGRRPSSVEADLRARTAYERERLIEDAIADILSAGREAQLNPPSLILAPNPVRGRIERTRTLYGPMLEEADRWFVDSGGRALSLAALPGAQQGAAVLSGDVRDVVVQGCALAQASGRGIGQCRVGFLPKPPADAILAGLSLAVLWADDDQRPGARIVKAAYAAGYLDAAVAERIAFGDNPSLGRQALLASVMPILVDAGEAWTQPVRFEEALQRAAVEAAISTGIDGAERRTLFEGMGLIRRRVGALAAMRLSAALDTPEQVDRLAVLSETAGPQLLALQDLSPAALSSVLDEPAPVQVLNWARWEQRAKMEAAAAGALFLSAALLLLFSVIASAFRARGARPGWFERLDAGASRLILGKNF
jgi:hypothetical protein